MPANQHAMKTKLIGLLAVCALLRAGAEELNWMTDLPKALAKAKAENKLVMMDFTGSDWCPWCIKLKKEIFSQPEFATYAAKNIVPVEVDFPRHKELSDEQKQANAKLAKKFGIEGYPTVIV